MTNTLAAAVLTNGTIIVTTRAAGDGHFFLQSSSFSLDDMDDSRGPGCTPGDVAMCELLADNGYSPKLIPDKALSTYAWHVSAGVTTKDVYGNDNTPNLYYTGQNGPAGGGTYNTLMAPMLVVLSGSGSSADAIQPNIAGVPIVIGEHGSLGSAESGVPDGHGEHFLYTSYGTGGGHGNDTTLANAGPGGTTNGAYQYMKVLNPSHPIMQGIPLVSLPASIDSGGNPVAGDPSLSYVKIIRDRYPNENAHVEPSAPAGLPNYVPSTTWVATNLCPPASGLQILGVMAAANNKVIFACMDQGGGLGPTTDSFSPWNGLTTSPTRMVHFFVCENGGGNSRRAFNTLTVWGRILFVRCCQWAMWENLQPYQGLGIIDVGLVSPGNIRLSWTGSSQYNYRIYGATDIVNPNWLPVVDSIVNKGEGVKVTRTLNIASAPQAVYLRVASLPFNYFNP